MSQSSHLTRTHPPPVALPQGLGDRYPRQLSGGQRQRVAMARALASNPRLLLLDEPFGALDAVVRKQLRQGLREIVRSVGVTTIIVTHDQEEAFDLADKVGAEGGKARRAAKQQKRKLVDLWRGR